MTKKLKAVLFDFDNTIVNTSHLRQFRESNDFGAISDDDIAQTKSYGPITNILKKLKEKGIRTGVVTNSPASYVSRIIAHHNLSDLLDTVVTYNDVTHVGKKPSPKGIQIALERLGVSASSTAYVGDEYTDVVAAYRADVIPVIPTWASRKSVSTPPATELSSGALIELVDDVEQKILFAERCAIHKSTDFDRTEARFLPLDEDSNVATIRHKMKTFCLGRYFSQKGITTAKLHDKHPLSLEIAAKDHIANYKPPLWMAEMLLKIAKSAGAFLFNDGQLIDLVTVVPGKPNKPPRLEILLAQMEALAIQAGFPMQFASDILYFDKASSKSLKGMNSHERCIEQDAHLHAREIDLSNNNVLVIDDVITTGATIQRSIGLLESLGAKSVHGLGIAKTVSIVEDTKPCPQCSRDMIIQKNKTTGERFWSCSGNWPNNLCFKHTHGRSILMPIHHAIWRVGESPEPLTTSRLAGEQQLEEMIVCDPRILSSEWMLIGRQERTNDGKRIDLLAIAPDGSLVLVELKRDRTPREVVAQALDYAAWVSELTTEKLVQIYQRFSGGDSLDTAFRQRFGAPLDEETLNQSHQIILVAAELDPSTERIVTYLNARDIAINVLFFQVFQLGSEKLLSRAWLIDPTETQINAAQTAGGISGESREPWNGEFYVSFGDRRNWEDARRYGFISGGGGTWYSQTLRLLQPGDRVWVKIPGKGYVGVGRVIEPVQSVSTFTASTSEGDKPVLDVLRDGDFYRANADSPDLAEYFVRVKWMDTFDTSHAINEVGLFGNQNTVCKPTTPKWRHTVERLKTKFASWDKA